MGRSQEQGQGPIQNLRLSTVGATRPTETGMTHEPTGLDLAMKLHYLKAAYIYSSETARDLTVTHLKEAMFMLFDQIAWTTGRFSRRDSGRPYIKCNDSGARFVEGECNLTVEEWLSKPDRSDDEFLIYHQPIGPELAFSPLIYVQMTRFKCGGLGLGVSWANIMGDPFSLAYALNLGAKAISGEKVCVAATGSNGIEKQKAVSGEEEEPVIIKRVEAVGDLWAVPKNKKMASHSLRVPAKGGGEVFEMVAAMIWKCIARVREEPEPEPVTVTMVRKDPKEGKDRRGIRNGQMIISSVHADFAVAEAEVEELVECMGKARDERCGLEAIGERCDLVLYGAKLTFVDLTQVDFYEAKLMGNSPVSVYCNVQGVGEEGLVVLLRPPNSPDCLVTITLPDDHMEGLLSELHNCAFISP